MYRLRDCVEIDAAPERVWDWLTRLADHYTAWHPDHVSAGWTEGEANAPGAVLQVVERLGGRREVLRLQVTAVDPPRRLDYRFRGHAALFLSGGSFRVEPSRGGALFAAEIDCRPGLPVGALFRRRAAVLRAHMQEEGANLKRMLEAAG